VTLDGLTRLKTTPKFTRSLPPFYWIVLSQVTDANYRLHAELPTINIALRGCSELTSAGFRELVKLHPNAESILLEDTKLSPDDMLFAAGVCSKLKYARTWPQQLTDAQTAELKRIVPGVIYRHARIDTNPTIVDTIVTPAADSKPASKTTAIPAPMPSTTPIPMPAATPTASPKTQ